MLPLVITFLAYFTFSSLSHFQMVNNMQPVKVSYIFYTEFQPTEISSKNLDFSFVSKQLAFPSCTVIDHVLPAIGDGQGNASGSWWHPLYSLCLQTGTRRTSVGQSHCVVCVEPFHNRLFVQESKTSQLQLIT